MKTKIAKIAVVLIILSLLLTAFTYGRIIRINTGDYRENVCLDGQIPTVWVHHNVAVVRCE